MNNIISTILLIWILFLIGYLAKKTNIVKEDIIPSLNSLAINIFFPCMIFYCLYNSNLDQISNFAFLPVIIIIVALIIGFISFFILKKLNWSNSKILAVVIPLVICNTGFMGYPIISGIFAQEGLVRAIFCDISASVLFLIWVFIIILIQGGTFKNAFLRVLKLVPLWAIFLGIVFNLNHIPLDPFILNVIEVLSKAAIPIIMISLGLSIEFSGLVRNRKIVLISTLIKLLIFPLIVFIIAIFIGISGLELKVLVAQSAMPSGLLSLVISVEYQLDYKITSDIIVIDTFFSLITLPFILYLF